MTSASTTASMTARAAGLVFARVLAFAVSFVLPMLLVRRLSQHDFGVYKQLFLVVGTAITLLPIGFGMSVYYYLPREPARQAVVVFNVLVFYATTSGLACLALWINPSLLTTLFKSDEFALYATPLGFVIVSWVIASFLEIIVIANQEARLAVGFIVAANISKSLLLVAAALSGSLTVLLYAAVCHGVLQTTALWWYLHCRFGRFWTHFDLPMMRRQLSYALPLGFAGLLYSLQTDLHSYFVSHKFGPETYAIYAIGCFQLPLIGIVSEAMTAVMIPHVSILQQRQDHQAIVDLTCSVARKLAFLFFPLYVLLLVVAHDFITVLFTAKYVASVPIFMINLTLLPFSAVLLDPLQRAYADLRYFVLATHSVLTVALTIALWFGIRYFGLIGAISAVVSINLIGRLVVGMRLSRVIHATKVDFSQLKGIARIAIAAAGAGAVTVLLRRSLFAGPPLPALIGCSVAFAVLYAIGIGWLGVITQGESAVIRCHLARSLVQVKQTLCGADCGQR